MTTEQREFQAETRQLLDLMVHSIYSNKDSFLRELVSNSSDALDKLRLESYRDKDLDVDVSDLHIEFEIDKQARTLTIRDNGIGMTREEVIDLIGTLAKSGTAEVRKKLKEAKDAAASEELIGQFGIGFYSTFMVADKVTLLTRKAGESTATRWESTGEGTYEISDVDGARMLVALETISTRDALWEDMSRENHTSHMALWNDLTRRAPDEVRAAPASMLGFASWLHGDGAKAWCALDQVPADRPYSMAAIVASALQNGIHPREWERYQTQMRDIAADLDESFVPKPPGQQRDIPGTQPVTDRPTPGR